MNYTTPFSHISPKIFKAWLKSDKIKISLRKAVDYSQWSYKQLYSLAQEMNIKGRSKLNKAQLIKALSAV